MPTVRTTKCPWQEIEVDAAEYLDLKRMGLLAEEEPQAQPTPPAALVKKTGSPG